VESCERCRQELAELSKISNALRRALLDGEQPELVERIKAGVQEKLSRDGKGPSKRAIDFPFWISSVAAGLAVCALGAYVLTHMESSGQPERSASSYEVASAPRQSTTLSAPSRTALDPLEGTSLGSIDLKKLSSASFDGENGAGLIAGAASGEHGKRPAMIEERVKQVWMAPQGLDVKNRIESVLKALSLTDKASLTPSEDGSTMNLSAALDRRQSVLLVRALKSSGFDLLSPSQPQPEQNVFRGNGTESVVYDANFVFKR
jgi:hypothetical protein